MDVRPGRSMTTHDALLDTLLKAHPDRSVAGPLADYLEENDRPNAHLFRAWLNRGYAHLPQIPFDRQEAQATTDSAQDGAGNSWSGAHGLSNYIFLHHAPDNHNTSDMWSRRMVLTVPVKHKQDARHLISDLPGDVKQMFEEQLIPHLPDGPAEDRQTRSNTHLLPTGRNVKPHIATQLARTAVRRLLRTPAESFAPSDSKHSLDALESAVRSNPQDAQAWSLLAIAYQAAGRNGEAAEARALAGILARLARPTGKITAKNLTGEAFRQREITDKYETPVKRYAIDPQIAGTAFAYHLRKIAQSGKPNTASLAEYALAGRTPPGVNGDVYRALGNRLRAEKHPLANAYDWSGKSRSLSVDNWLERFLRKNVQQSGLADHDYFDRVRRQFGNGAGRNRGYHALWSRLQKAAAADNYVLDAKHHADLQQTIEDSLHRISDRHLDREYLRQKGDPAVFESHPRGALRLQREPAV